MKLPWSLTHLYCYFYQNYSKLQQDTPYKTHKTITGHVVLSNQYCFVNKTFLYRWIFLLKCKRKFVSRISDEFVSRNEEHFNPPAACGIQRSHARQKSKLSKEYKLQNSKKINRLCVCVHVCLYVHPQGSVRPILWMCNSQWPPKEKSH